MVSSPLHPHLDELFHTRPPKKPVDVVICYLALGRDQILCVSRKSQVRLVSLKLFCPHVSVVKVAGKRTVHLLVPGTLKKKKEEKACDRRPDHGNLFFCACRREFLYASHLVILY
ncbi:hypothetical protein ACOSQ3_018701 [Xanthoceras sorbifolium]